MTRSDVSTSDVVGRYLRGDGMRKIAADLDCSFGLVRTTLVREGVQLRPRGGARDQSSRQPSGSGRAREKAPVLTAAEVAKLRQLVGLTT